jgi:hypothetical protein
MASTCKLKPEWRKETLNETPILKVHCMQNKKILHKNYTENKSFYLFTLNICFISVRRNICNVKRKVFLFDH